MTTLTHLREPELYGRMVTDEMVAMIAEHLKIHTSLDQTFKWNVYTIWYQGFMWSPIYRKTLNYLMQENQRQFVPECFALALNCVLAVYDVILSLPNISYVKLVAESKKFTQKKTFRQFHQLFK